MIPAELMKPFKSSLAPPAGPESIEAAGEASG